MVALVIGTNLLPQYTLQQGLLRYKGRICIGPDLPLRQRIVSVAHSFSWGGHSGISHTYQRLKQLFY